MINYFLPAVLFSFFSIFILYIYICKNGVKKSTMRELFGILIMLFGISAIIVIVFFPFPVQASEIEFMKSNNLGQHNSLIPFHTIYTCIREAFQYGYWSVLIYQLCGNILLFVPFGFGLALYLSDTMNNSFCKILIVSLIFSISIELLQYFFSSLLGYTYRSMDIDDVMLNTIGGIMGYLLVNVWFKK